MDLASYLRRIRFTGDVRPDLTTLEALHRAHVTHVPYENLDVQLRRLVTTDVTEAYEKIVVRERGGWCYEMNGVFGWALEQAGFNVTRIAADNGVAPAAHLCLRVELDRAYCCDVGFGDGPFEPYAIVDHEFQQEGFCFRVELRDGGGWRLRNHRFGAVPFYDAVRTDEAAVRACSVMQQTDPASVLVQNAVVYIHKNSSILSLIGRVLRETTRDGVHRTLIDDAAGYVGALRTHFGLDLSEAAGLWPAICARHEAIVSKSQQR